MYKQLEHVTKELSIIREKSYLRGKHVGFDCLNDIFTIKKGYPLFIAGAPHSSKTEFVLELLINLSEFYGWKHYIYLGETGSVAEQISELCHKYIKKPYRKFYEYQKEDKYAMTDIEKQQAELFVNEYFYFQDTEETFTMEQFYQNVHECENEMGITFDTTLIDPFFDVDEEVEKYGGREDKYLKQVLKDVRIDARKNKRVNIIVHHIADVKIMVKDGKRYYPKAMPNEWAGGRTWYRRAFTMLLCYRPPEWLNDENGVPYGKNITIIENQKAKPKGSGKLGECRLYWDWKKSRFYEKDDLGNVNYAKKEPAKYHNPKTNTYQYEKPDTDCPF